jgi:hypothetical protein
VLFTDIVGSTEHLSDMGDGRWRHILDRHYEIIDRLVARFRGRRVNTTGDGVFVSFDGPARAVRCAAAIRDAMNGLGLRIRAGVHCGEVEPGENELTGVAVHTAARVLPPLTRARYSSPEPLSTSLPDQASSLSTAVSTSSRDCLTPGVSLPSRGNTPNRSAFVQSRTEHAPSHRRETPRGDTRVGTSPLEFGRYIRLVEAAPVTPSRAGSAPGTSRPRPTRWLRQGRAARRLWGADRRVRHG